MRAHPFHFGRQYRGHSLTQQIQGDRLIDVLPVPGKIRDILDVGCGDGLYTYALASGIRGSRVTGIDLSEPLIQEATQQYPGLIFQHQDVMTLKDSNAYDLIFSNAALHWVPDGPSAYRILFNALRPGGTLLVHQGGSDSYQGLHRIVRESIEELGFKRYFRGWKYPVFYPAPQYLFRLLVSIGFSRVRVNSIQSDGREYPTLAHDFEYAGMLPYFDRLPGRRHKFRLSQSYRKRVKKGIDLSTHRLYIKAVK